MIDFYLSICFLICSVPENGEAPMDLDVFDFKSPGIALA